MIYEEMTDLKVPEAYNTFNYINPFCYPLLKEHGNCLKEEKTVAYH